MKTFLQSLKLATKMGLFLLDTRQSISKERNEGSLSNVDTSYYVAVTSQRHWSHLGISCDISTTCQVGQSYLGTR